MSTHASTEGRPHTDEQADDAGRTIRWGIAGPGRMAEQFVQDFAHVDGAVAQAVGSRDPGRARAFAERHQIPTAHGSYAELCADPEVDVVYVATPHPQHRALALEAIRNGKAVLVEKSFAATLAGAQEVVDAAREAGVFCMEAMWTRFHPVVRELHRIVDSGQLGTLRAVQGELFAHRDFAPDDRLFAKELGGGAILDLGVYVLSFATDLLGAPDELQVLGSLFPNGVDAQAAMQLHYPSGVVASLACSLQARGAGRMTVVGDEGWAEVMPQFHHSHELAVHRHGALPVVHDLPLTGIGYSHEIEAVSRAVREGRTEHEWMPLHQTLLVQGLMEQALHALGINHVDQPL